jgi:hypothetical protein
MAGRGIVEPQDTIGNNSILCLNKEGDWEIAKEPLHFDKSVAGVGPGLAFAREMLIGNDSIVIGLIPCAAGGSGIEYWLKDLFWEQTSTFPYNNALLRAKLAMKDGTLKGILWHQGEADCSPVQLKQYKENLITLIQKIRKDLNTPDLPFIAGELPYFNPCSKDFNSNLHEIKNLILFFDVVSAEKLSSLPDKIHLDAASAREIGKRYANSSKKFH